MFKRNSCFNTRRNGITIVLVYNAHDSKGQPHVHFKDGTSLNRDGTIHDKGHGRPNPSSKVWDWLHKHGWCQNGIK